MELPITIISMVIRLNLAAILHGSEKRCLSLAVLASLTESKSLYLGHI